MPKNCYADSSNKTTEPDCYGIKLNSSLSKYKKWQGDEWSEYEK